MSDPNVNPAAPAAEAAPGLTQWQRLYNVFNAPSKTFEDIKRGNRSWWLPFLVSVVFTFMLFGAVTAKVGWNQVAENIIRANPTQSARMSELPADQRARAMHMTAVVTEITVAASPVLGILMALIAALLLWGTVNFGFGGKATYAQVFTVYYYAMLPLLLLPLMGTLALMLGMAPDAFFLSNYAGTNVAYYLSFEDTNKALYNFLMQFDIANIWGAILLSMGIATVAGKKRGAGYATVFGWWAIWTVFRVIAGLIAG